MGTARDVDAYLKGLPAQQRAALSMLRAQIKAAAPMAQESISYGMPAYKVNGRPLLYFAAAKAHCGLYGARSAAEETTLAHKLKGFKQSKGTIQFTPDKPIPAALVTQIVKARLAAVLEREVARKKKTTATKTKAKTNTKAKRTRGGTVLSAWVVLFRGINVGGANVLRMQDLVTLLEAGGCNDVRTHIQSGNVTLRSDLDDAAKLQAWIETEVKRKHRISPRVMVLAPSALERAIARNPYPEADIDPKRVHLFFLAATPKAPDLAGLERIKIATERFHLEGQVLYLHTPDGFGTSKLATRAEHLLGVAATARNWRTVTTLRDMAKQE